MDQGNHKDFKIALDMTVATLGGDRNHAWNSASAAETLEFALECANAGVWELDFNARTAWLSPQSCRMLGLPDNHSGELSLEEMLRLINSQDTEQFQPPPISLFETFTHEFSVSRPDGEVRWLRLTGRLLPDEKGNPTRLLGLQFDDTERKHAEELARESEDRFRLVQEAALIGTFVTDADRITVGTRQFYHNLGLPEDTVSIDRKTHSDLTHPDDRERLRRETEIAERSDDGLEIEYRIRRADTGESRWIFARTKFERDGNGELIRTVGAHLDITEHKRAEEALRESEDRLHLIQESILIGTFVTEDQLKVIGSRQFYRNLGLPDHTRFLHRETIYDIIHPEDRKRVEQASAAAQSSAEGRDVRFRIRRSDTGELRWIYSRIKCVYADDGQLLRVVGVHIDITETQRAEEALQESTALSQSLIESSADCVTLMDLDGRMLFVNEPCLATFEVEDASTLLGKEWAGFWPVAEHAKIRAAIRAACDGQTGRFNAGGLLASGERKWWDVIVTPIRDEQGTPRQLLAVSRDLTEHRNQVAKIRWTASHDMLTELPNRRYFQDRLEKVLAAAAAQASQVGLLQLDVDDFKQTNDTLGHDAGDALLKAFTQRLLKATGANEMVARLGGDEFAIIVPDVSDSSSLSGIVDDIQAQLSEPIVHQGHIFDCRASIGLAIYPEHGETVKELLKSSDIALYSAKAAGRGNVRLFDPSMRAEMQARLDMVSLARSALTDDLIFPFYQPKIDFRSGAPAGFEALLRWQDCAKRIQPPAEIAAAFEDLDVAQALSERMQLRVLADIRRWLDDGIDFGHVAINASAAEFRQNDFAERLLNRLKDAGVPTSCFELEVTETVFMGRGADYVDRALHLLSAEGIRIALDDFGTGYASLSHLRQFPVDIIKIDQSFVRKMHVVPDDLAIVKTLIGLAKSLSIDIVAEGVENYAQSSFLAELGCDFGQGYLFSKAVAAAEVPELISSIKTGRSHHFQEELNYSI